MHFADTSFLCALYRNQDQSILADAHLLKHGRQVSVSSLVLWEFRHSTRFQVFRHSQDQKQGFSKAEADRMLVVLDKNLAAAALSLLTVDWPDVHSLAERFSAQWTITGGHRPMDILHVATAVHLRSEKFLTFDCNQKKLAEAVGLSVSF